MYICADIKYSIVASTIWVLAIANQVHLLSFRERYHWLNLIPISQVTNIRYERYHRFKNFETPISISIHIQHSLRLPSSILNCNHESTDRQFNSRKAWHTSRLDHNSH
jgi:hypothetical protein